MKWIKNLTYHLEKQADKWLKDSDWWTSYKNYDINVHHKKNYIQIDVYKQVKFKSQYPLNDEIFIETDTSKTIEIFKIIHKTNTGGLSI